MNLEHKPIVCIDFDGVIHSYEFGWQDGEIYGTVVDGFWYWAENAVKHFQLVVFSSRLRNANGAVEIDRWLNKQWDKYCHDTNLIRPMPELQFSYSKPPALVTIDDRAMTFNGDWFDPSLTPEAIGNFTPWMMRK